MARTQNGELLNTLQSGFKHIENESFNSTFQGLFSEINLGSEKLGKGYTERNAKLCTIIQKIAEGLAKFSTDSDTLGDAYEYLIGQFASGSGKKAGEFYTPQQISRNVLNEGYIARISKTYQFREEEDRYSRRIPMDRIEKEGCNLNISRYISTAVSEEEIKLEEVQSKLLRIEQDIQITKRSHDAFLKELGLAELP